MKKNLICLLSVIVLSFSFTARAKQVSVPDLVNVELDDAKIALQNCSLIPSAEYENSDSISEGIIIRTEPAAGTKVDENTKVTLFVSSGPEYIDAKNASIDWYLIGDGEDWWEFNKPYIQGDVLYIHCSPTFEVDMTWKGSGFGIASESSSFEHTVPVTVEYENQENKKGTEQDIWIDIPLGSFENDRPANVYTKLYALVDGNEKEIKVNFTIEW